MAAMRVIIIARDTKQPTPQFAYHVSLVQKGANAPFGDLTGEERNRCRLKLRNKVTVIAVSYLVM
jgi:hypothetical protein